MVICISRGGRNYRSGRRGGPALMANMVARAAARSKRSLMPTRDLWDLDLYVAGRTPKSFFALSNLRAVCRELLPGRHRIRLIDVQGNPDAARRNQIVAIPTVIRTHPLPPRKSVGNLADRESVIAGLGLPER